MTAGTLTEVPLGLDLVFPNRPPCRIELGGLPCGRLVRQLAEALLDRTNTAGTVKAPDTARAYASNIRHLPRHLGARGFEGGVAELTASWRRRDLNHLRADARLNSQSKGNADGDLTPLGDSEHRSRLSPVQRANMADPVGPPTLARGFSRIR